MALTFDGDSAPTQGADGSINTTGITVDLTAVADRQHGILTLSADGYFKRGDHDDSGLTWMYVPGGVPRVIYNIDQLDTLGLKAATGTIGGYLEVLSPAATIEGRQ